MSVLVDGILRTPLHRELTDVDINKSLPPTTRGGQMASREGAKAQGKVIDPQIGSPLVPWRLGVSIPISPVAANPPPPPKLRAPSVYFALFVVVSAAG